MNQDELKNVTKKVTPLLRRGDGGEAVTPSILERGLGLPAEALAKAGDAAIVNRVQSSPLITLDLEQYFTTGDRVFYDLKPLLFQELVLREKDFRATLKSTDWSAYQDKHVAIGCTADAIIPTWAFMLVAIHLQPVAQTVFSGTLAEMETHLFRQKIENIDWSQFQGSKVVVKGCSKVYVPESVYVEVATKLKPVAASIMFGEPCSTVPLFKASNG